MFSFFCTFHTSTDVLSQPCGIESDYINVFINDSNLVEESRLSTAQIADLKKTIDAKQTIQNGEDGEL